MDFITSNDPGIVEQDVFYSASTNGFYHTAVHGDRMPVDVVSVGKAHYDAIFEKISAGGFSLVPDVVGAPTLLPIAGWPTILSQLLYKIRVARTPRLAELDLQFMRNMETGSDNTQVIAEKNRLRDITKGVTASTTQVELEAIIASMGATKS